MHNRRFYLSSKLTLYDYAEIIGSDALHINRVLRMTVGQNLEIFDGTGKQYIAKITYVSHRIVRVRIIRSYKSNSESPVSITLAQAFLKGKKMDVLIRQLTELGISRWVPFNSNRSVPIVTMKRLTSRMERWRRISIEALKQCHRGTLPHISFLENFENVLDLFNEHDFSLIFWERRTSTFKTSWPINHEGINKILIVIGPEGGFDVQEIENAISRGFVLSGLGPRILRSETASVAACSIIQYLFGDMNKTLDIVN